MEGRTIVLVDASGFDLLPGLVRTYAPGAQTPVLRSVYTHAHWSVMSGITMPGRLSTMVRRETLDSRDSAVVLHHVRRHMPDTWLVIWDGSPTHTGDVNTCLAEGGAKQIHLAHLPPYAPDLNPDEGVWHDLKHVEMRNVCGLTLTPLRTELRLAIRR